MFFNHFFMRKAQSEAKSPFLFEIRNPKTNKKIYGSVLEFVAPEGMVFLPDWMLHAIDAPASTLVDVKVVDLPKATYAKLRPVNYEEFKKLPNARDLLESKLRSFFTLMKGSTISVHHSGEDYIFQVVDLKPKEAVCILNADLNTEFDLPKDHGISFTESGAITEKEKKEEEDDSDNTSEETPAFKGKGYTINSPLQSKDSEQEEFKANMSVCGNCEKKVPSASLHMHEAFCTRNVFKCAECGKAVAKEDKEKHMREAHGPVKCDKCGTMCVKDLLETHQLFECSKREVLCQFCNLSFLSSQFDEHESLCGSRTEKCDICHRRVQLRDFQRHKTSNCSYFPKQDRPSLKRDKSLFICGLCHAPFTEISQLDSHTKKEHGISDLNQRAPQIPFGTELDFGKQNSASNFGALSSAPPNKSNNFANAPKPRENLLEKESTNRKYAPSSKPEPLTVADDDLLFCHYCLQPFQQFEDLQNHIETSHKDEEKMDTGEN